MTTLLLIRHGANDLVGRALAGRAPGVHLNAEGRRQAEALADGLAGAPIRALYSSPLDRARETARPLADRLGLEVRVAEPLNEVDFGAWQGRTLDELDPDPLWRRYNTFRGGTRPPGGELMLEVQARVVGFLQALAAEDGGLVALFSHGDVIRSAVLYYLGMPIDLFLRLEIDPASISAVALGADAARVLFVNTTAGGPALGG